MKAAAAAPNHMAGHMAGPRPAMKTHTPAMKSAKKPTMMKPSKPVAMKPNSLATRKP